MAGTTDWLGIAFSATLDGLGPFEPNPALAVAVSGGADSMALAILTSDWAKRRGGSVVGLVVDHGLRPTSADEAAITVERLTHLGIPARLLPLRDLRHGPALAERARNMRYQILARACREAGVLHLLLGHHAADQAETLAMRVLRGSQTHGLAGMAALRETTGVRLLRPLLGIAPARLRDLLVEKGADWIEDPSNRDLRALRPRLRHQLCATTAEAIPTDAELTQAMSAVAELRAREETEIAAELASRVSFRPEGFALLSRGRISPGALSSLVRTIGGSPYGPSPAQINNLAACPEPTTVAGVRLMQAGRLGDGLLIVREEKSVMASVPLQPETIWDNQFCLVWRGQLPPDATVGKLGADAARFRNASDLPSVVLRTLPTVRSGQTLAVVPHLAPNENATVMVIFTPPRPAAGPCFVAEPPSSRLEVTFPGCHSP